MSAARAGAQTERRGGAGPARGLLGGKTAPAACCLRRTRSALYDGAIHFFGLGKKPPSPDAGGSLGGVCICVGTWSFGLSLQPEVQVTNSARKRATRMAWLMPSSL